MKCKAIKLDGKKCTMNASIQGYCVHHYKCRINSFNIKVKSGCWWGFKE